MTLTLTHLDPTMSAHQSLPGTDPTSGTVVFTGRPGRASDRAFGMTQDLLGGFGARPDVSGAGRRVAENILRIRARIRAYGTRMVVVRHADMLHPHKNTDILDTLWDLCRSEDVALAVTCDDTVGDVLAEWVSQRSGHVHRDATDLIAQLPTPQDGSGREPERFPADVPTGDFYIFRSRARELLSAEAFEAVDDLYVSTAREVHVDPFCDPQEAADRLQRSCSASDSPAYAVTVLRAAQAAMFRHGVLLKVNVPTFTRLVADAQHRQLNASELRALRAYASTVYSCGTVLLDAGLPAADVASLPLSAVDFDGTISDAPVRPEARELLAIHRSLRALEGAAGTESFIGRKHNRIMSDRRLVATELRLPGSQSNADSRSGTGHRWNLGLGVTLQPLEGQHLPSSSRAKAATKEAS